MFPPELHTQQCEEALKPRLNKYVGTLNQIHRKYMAQSERGRLQRRSHRALTPSVSLISTQHLSAYCFWFSTLISMIIISRSRLFYQQKNLKNTAL